MLASKALMEKLRRLMKNEPLKLGELRRISGMGSHYASLNPTHEGKQHFFSVQVGEQPIYIYKQ